jgi:hypothetical protein
MVLGGIVLALRVGSLLVGALREEAGAIPGARFEDNVIGKGWPGARRNGALAPKGA